MFLEDWAGRRCVAFMWFAFLGKFDLAGTEFRRNQRGQRRRNEFKVVKNELGSRKNIFWRTADISARRMNGGGLKHR